MEQLNICCKTDIGLVRKTNQDSVKSVSFSNLNACLVVVCDGIGGLPGGDVASDTASSVICDYFEKNKIVDIKNMILESFKVANEKIIEISKQNNSPLTYGTTCVASFVENTNVHIANVGDSRAYVVSDSNIRQITKDHSIVNELLLKGKITEEEAKIAPNKNIITRALGTVDSTPDYYNFCLEKGDKILLCTDGLSNYLSDGEIYDIVSKNVPEDSLNCLIDKAKSLGGNDNITVSIIF